MKKWLNLIAVSILIVSLSGVSAAFSPAMKELESAYDSGEGFSLDLTAQVTDWKALSKDSLPAVRELLQNLSLRFNFSKKAESLQLVQRDTTVFNLQLFEDEGESRFYLPLQGLGYATQNEGKALDMFVGNNRAAFLLGLAQEPDFSFLADLPQTALHMIAPFAQTQQRKTVIKAAGTSRESVSYKLPADLWQNIWQDILYSLTQKLPNELGTTKKALSLIQFEKPVTIIRYLDRAGLAMGWRFNGEAKFSQNDERKLSLTIGHQEGNGFSLSLKAPAVKGKNNLLLALTFVLKKESLAADLLYESRLEKERYFLKMDAAVNNSLAAGEEHVTGTIWLEEKVGIEKARRFTLKPDMMLGIGTARGTVHLLGQRAGKPELDVSINLALGKGKDEERAEPVQFDPSLQVPEAAGKVVTVALLPLMRDLLMTLPLPQRKLLLHDMGRTLRTEGIVLPPIHEVLPDYLVIDEP